MRRWETKEPDDLAAQTAKAKQRSGKSLQFESRVAGVIEIAK